MLRDARRPFGTQNAIGNFLYVRKQEIHRAALAFAGAQIHLACARNQIVDIGRGFFQASLIFLRALFADVKIGVSLLIAHGWKRENAHFEILLQQKGQRALGGRLSCRIGVVVHHHALGETAEQLDLLLGEARSAACHHVADPRARHGNGVHIAFDENDEVLPPDAFFRAVQVVEYVAF